MLIALVAPSAAVLARVQEGHAQSIVALAAGEGGVLCIAAALAVAVVAHGSIPRDTLAGRNGARLEIDDAAHVLRAEAHCTATTDDVDRFDVVQAQWCERKLGLAVGCHRQGNAIEQDGRAWRKAPGQAAHPDIQGNGAAGRTGAVTGLHARNAAHHFADADGAGAVDVLLPDHGAGAGIGLHAALQPGAEPVAADLDRLQRGLPGGRGGLLRHAWQVETEHHQRNQGGGSDTHIACRVERGLIGLHYFSVQ